MRRMELAWKKNPRVDHESRADDLETYINNKSNNDMMYDDDIANIDDGDDDGGGSGIDAASDNDN